ncbi:TPA: hypothetical protein ACL4BG_000040 [Streptococcus pneumoniae]
MAHLKSFITRYSKVYIGLVLLIWLSFFFIPWDRAILGVRIDIFIIQKVLLVFGLICCLSLWINLFITFAILPIFGN